MKHNITKFNDFFALYHLLLINLMKTKKQFTIYIYYLNKQFNIEIEEREKEIVFRYHLNTTLEEYFNLVYYLGDEFIETHTITLPIFDYFTRKDSELYYQSLDSRKIPLDYNKAMIHILRNNYFELKFYYFNGLNTISYELQDKALKKRNQELVKVKKL